MGMSALWLVHLLVASGLQGGRSLQLQSEGCIPRANHPDTWRSAWKNTAFVVGGMGKYGILPGIRKCLALAESLGSVGGWKGNVYIMTDSALDKETMAKLHEGNPQVKVRVIEPTRDGVDFRKFSAGGGGGYLKSMLLDLPDVHEDVLIWHDCDKVIAKPDCINDMFNASALEFGPDQRVLLGQFPGGPGHPGQCHSPKKGQFAGRCGDSIHVGVFAVHRQWSKPILDLWKKNQQAEPGVYDRYTFWNALQQLDMLANVTNLPQNFKDHMWNKGFDGCVNHISGPRAWDPSNAGGLQPLLYSMCLRSCTGKELLEVYANCLKWKHGQVVFDPRIPEAANLIDEGLECSGTPQQ